MSDEKPREFCEVHPELYFRVCDERDENRRFVLFYKGLLAKVTAERDEARAEIERLGSTATPMGLFAEIDKLKAEVERLSGLPYVRALEREANSLRLLAESYRSILAKLMDENISINEYTKACVEARAALGEK